jgi:hypothetical protein
MFIISYSHDCRQRTLVFDSMDVKTLKKMNKNKNFVKKYHAFLATMVVLFSRFHVSLILNKAGKCSVLLLVSQLVDLLFGFSWLRVRITLLWSQMVMLTCRCSFPTRNLPLRLLTGCSSPCHLCLCGIGCNNAGGLSGERARPRIRCRHHRESGLPDRKVLCSWPTLSNSIYCYIDA